MNVTIPYGTTGIQLKGRFPSVEVLESAAHQLSSGKDEDEIVKQAMKRPVKSEPLWKLAKGKRSAVIIISDHTRPVPSQHILPYMLEELREGNPDIDVTLLVATGFHRATTKEELISKLGYDIWKREKVVVHDCQDAESCVDIGILPSGARLVISRLAVETELLLAEGFIEPHFFAGFSGGRKSVLPGICSRTTVLGNHCSAFIDDDSSRAGILETNLIHQDMIEAAKLAGLKYIVNVILDVEKRVVAAFAGDAIEAHAKGCLALSKLCQVSPQRQGDIVVTSNGGAPLDQNVYQAVKGLTAAESAAAPGAVLIICARCNDGAGGEGFYQALKNCASPTQLLQQVRQVPMDQTQPDQWQYQIMARILEKHEIIFVADPEKQMILEEMKLGFASSLEQALEMAFQKKGSSAHLVVIPDGVSVVVRPAGQ